MITLVRSQKKSNETTNEGKIAQKLIEIRSRSALAGASS